MRVRERPGLYSLPWAASIPTLHPANRRPIWVVPFGFQWENQAQATKRRVYLLNDRMPTGLVVSPAMNHGGPFPATGHPGFTAVGIPASLLRFAALHGYDNVREHRRPLELRDHNPNGQMWRRINGEWTRGDVPISS